MWVKGLISRKEPITLIEGVGSNLGILWKYRSDHSHGLGNAATTLWETYLLCNYKDGRQTTYHNRRYDGDCNPDLHADDPGDESGGGRDIILYPQPVRGTVWIDKGGAGPIRSIQIFTLQGRLLQQVSGDDLRMFETGDLPSGIYYVKLYSDQGFLATKSLDID